MLAASKAVEWPVSSARFLYSSVNVESWINRSNPETASMVDFVGLVSPVYAIFLPGLDGPTTCSGEILVPSFRMIGVPSCSVEKSFHTGTPSFSALSLKNRPLRCDSISAYPVERVL